MRSVLRLLAPFLWTVAILAPTSYLVLYALEAIYEIPLSVDSFRFERVWAALLFPAGLLAMLARGLIHRHAAPRLLISRTLALGVAPRGVRLWISESLTGLRVTALTLMVFALMGPQSIHARSRAEVEGIDIVLSLDLSLSMQAADIEPSRFAATKVVVDDFISRRPNDRIGAVVFGREAYTLLPLTTDQQALRTMIQELQLGTIDGRGTAIGNAVAVSLNRLRRSNAKSKVIILLTDGDSNSGNVSPDQAAEFARTMKVKIFTILMGQSGDAPIQRGLDLFGRPLWDRGNFPVNPELLRNVATETGGEYFQVSDRESLVRSFHTILDRLEKSEIEDPGRVYAELFPAFIWPAFALMGLEILAGMLLFRRWP